MHTAHKRHCQKRTRFKLSVREPWWHNTVNSSTLREKQTTNCFQYFFTYGRGGEFHLGTRLNQMLDVFQLEWSFLEHTEPRISYEENIRTLRKCICYMLHIKHTKSTVHHLRKGLHRCIAPPQCLTLHNLVTGGLEKVGKTDGSLIHQ